MASADFNSADIYNGIIGMELPIRIFVGFAYALYIFDDVQRANKIHIDYRCVSYKTQHQIAFSQAGMDGDVETLQPCGKVV